MRHSSPVAPKGECFVLGSKWTRKGTAYSLPSAIRKVNGTPLAAADSTCSLVTKVFLPEATVGKQLRPRETRSGAQRLRTLWHTHPLGQNLIVTGGCGWVQGWGGGRLFSGKRRGTTLNEFLPKVDAGSCRGELTMAHSLG